MLLSAIFCFQIKQLFFYSKSAAKAYQRAVRPDNAVSGNDDQNIIAVIGAAYRPACFWFADTPGYLAIAGSLAIGHLLQFLPYQKLKCSSPGAQGYVELFALTAEILAELLPCFPMQAGFRSGCRMPGICKKNTGDGSIFCSYSQLSQGLG